MILETERLRLLSPDQVRAEEVAGYYAGNREFLKEFEPERGDEYYTCLFQEKSLREQAENWQEKREYRFYITSRDHTDQIIGYVSLSNVVMGAFCSCFLGYQLDRRYLRQGFMTEAVTEVVRYGFGRLGLHRIEGNVMPGNRASRGLLEKCGFTEEGISRRYLRINGVWEDHVHYVKLNEAME